MKAVVFYESAEDLAEKAPMHAGAHRARWREFADRGELLMIGPFANALADGDGHFHHPRRGRGVRPRRPLRSARCSTELDYPGMERGPHSRDTMTVPGPQVP